MPTFLPWLLAVLFALAAVAAITSLWFVLKARTEAVGELRRLGAQLSERERELAAERDRAGTVLRDYRAAYDSWQKADAALVQAQQVASEAEARLSSASGELERSRKELARRPQFRQQIYKIVSIGMPKTGKTSLTLKWANPLWELKNVQGTSFDRYTRTVSSVLSPQAHVIVNHVFEIYDYGGEQIVDAHDTMVLNDIHGLLFVVDLGGTGAEGVDPERIDAQIREFQPGHLRFFFKSPRITKTCRTVVLFINKSDLIPGTPAEIEAKARNYYAPLIEYLEEFSDHVEVEVMVGSAISGHNAHLLMPHFIRKLLPSEAFDEQLLQTQSPDDAFGGLA